jgi:hypothetical protein
MAVRVTQEAIETLMAPDTEARLTQIAAEALGTADTARGRLTQLAAEVLAKSIVGQNRVTQVAVEIIIPTSGA